MKDFDFWFDSVVSCENFFESEEKGNYLVELVLVVGEIMSIFQFLESFDV